MTEYPFGRFFLIKDEKLSKDLQCLNEKRTARNNLKLFIWAIKTNTFLFLIICQDIEAVNIADSAKKNKKNDQDEKKASQGIVCFWRVGRYLHNTSVLLEKAIPIPIDNPFICLAIHYKPVKLVEKFHALKIH